MSLELFELTGTVALITGSSRGLGLVLARGLGGAGAQVVLNGRDGVAVAAAVETLRADGLPAYGIPFDVTQPEAVAEAVARIEEEIGPIGCLVNNAGIQHRQPLEDFPFEEWARLVETNLTSAYIVGQQVARRMLTRRHGKIINVCSVQSELARRDIAPYVATKGALKMLTKGMCADWARRGIQANGLAPGYLLTELTRELAADSEFNSWVEARTPAGRWGEPEELVGAAVFLASRASDFVNGHILYVDGGIVSVA